ncbi:M4 family metallopeptidase [bacterium SCSIO 12741]|nr:M4 family metallopeptidase [bacterium SCSIO 12741]
MKKIPLLILALFATFAVFGQAKLERDELINSSQSFPGWTQFQNNTSLSPNELIENAQLVFELPEKSTFQVKSEATDPEGRLHVKLQQYHDGFEVQYAITNLHYDQDGHLQLANGMQALNLLSGTPGAPSLQDIQSLVIQNQDHIHRHRSTPIAEDNIRVDSTSAKFICGNPEAPLGERTFIPGCEAFAEIAGEHYILNLSMSHGGFISAVPLEHYCSGSTPAPAVNSPASYVGNVSSPMHFPLEDDGTNFILENTCEQITAYQNGFANKVTYPNSSTAIPYQSGLAYWAINTIHDYVEDEYHHNSLGGWPIAIENDFTQGASNASYRVDLINKRNNIYMFNPSSTAVMDIDVAGHEYGHGAAFHMAQIPYLSSTIQATIHESYADIFGAITEHRVRTDIGGTSLTNFTWQMNTGLNTLGRRINNPVSQGNPDSYLSTQWNSTSFGNPHARSSVLSYWFYLLSDGGTGTNNAPTTYSYNVGGIGFAEASDIAIRNLLYYMHPLADFQDIRNGAIQAATDIFGICSPNVFQTIEAFDAVGIYDQTNTCSVVVCADVNDANCQSNDGVIATSIHFKGTPSSVTYSWTGPNGFTANTPNASNLAPGSYQLTVSSSCGNQIFDYTVGNKEITNSVSQSPIPGGEHYGEVIAVNARGDIFLGGTYDMDMMLAGTAFPSLTPGNTHMYLSKYDSCGTFQWALFTSNENAKPIVMEYDEKSQQLILAFDQSYSSGNLEFNYLDATGFPTMNVASHSNSTPHAVMAIDPMGNINWFYSPTATQLILNNPGYLMIQDLAIDLNSVNNPGGSMYYLVGGGQKSSSQSPGAVDGMFQVIDQNGSFQYEHHNLATSINPIYNFKNLLHIKSVWAENGQVFMAGDYTTLDWQMQGASNDVGLISLLMEQPGGGYLNMANNWFNSKVHCSLEDVEHDPNSGLLLVSGVFQEDVIEKHYNQTDWYTYYTGHIEGSPGNQNVFFFKLDPQTLAFDKTAGTNHYFGTVGEMRVPTQVLPGQNDASYFHGKIVLKPRSSSWLDEFYIVTQGVIENSVVNYIPDALCSSGTLDINKVLTKRETYGINSYFIDNSSPCPLRLGRWFPGPVPNVYLPEYIYPTDFRYLDNPMVHYGGVAKQGDKLLITGTYSETFSLPIVGIVDTPEVHHRIFLTKHTIESGHTSSVVREDEEDELADPLVTSVESAESENNALSIYPNPVHGDLTIQSSGDAVIESIRVYSSDGRLMLEESNLDVSSFQISTSAWSVGLYSMHAVTEGQTQVIRIVKQ